MDSIAFVPLAACQFRPRGVVEEPVPEVDRTGARCAGLVFRTDDGFEAWIPYSVLERMVVFGRDAAPNEFIALVVGRLYKDAQGQHVIVEGLVPDPEAQAGPAHVRTTPDSELRTRLTASALFPDAVPIGWAHTHPRMRALFSGVDRQNQATWTQMHSIGLVVDPWNPDDVSLYRGPGSERMRRVDIEPASPVARPSEPRRAGRGFSSRLLRPHPVEETPLQTHGRRSRMHRAALAGSVILATGLLLAVGARGAMGLITKLNRIERDVAIVSSQVAEAEARHSWETTLKVAATDLARADNVSRDDSDTLECR